MPAALNEAFGSVAIYFACTLASAAGIGGGGLNLPILLVIWGFEFSNAVVLSLFAVLGNVLSQVFVNIQGRHPLQKTRPLIYFEAVLILLPAQLGGANIGVLIAKIAPHTILKILAMVTLVFACGKTLKKGLARWDAETAKKTLTEVKSVPIEQPLLPSSITEDSTPHSDLPIEFPSLIIKILFATWIVYASIFVGISQVDNCSSEYFVLVFITYPAIVGLIYWGVGYLRKRQEERNEAIIEGDINWNKSPYWPPGAASIIGTMTSLLGIGGGELMGPLLVHMKLLPQVSSATTSVLSLFTTSSSLLNYSINTSVPLLYGLWVFALGFAGGMSGRQAGNYIVNHFGRPSITVFALCVVLAIAIGLLVYDVVSTEKEFSGEPLC